MKILSLTLSLCLSGSLLLAAEQHDQASLIVVAKVADSRTIVHRKPTTALHYVRLKAEVEAVEAGSELLNGAKFIDIRCWQEGAAGQHQIPADGARFRAWLTSEGQGRWAPLVPDGFELLDEIPPRQFPEMTQHWSLPGLILGGLFGLLILSSAAMIRYRNRPPRDRSWSEPQ